MSTSSFKTSFDAMLDTLQKTFSGMIPSTALTAWNAAKESPEHMQKFMIKMYPNFKQLEDLCELSKTAKQPKFMKNTLTRMSEVMLREQDTPTNEFLCMLQLPVIWNTKMTKRSKEYMVIYLHQLYVHSLRETTKRDTPEASSLDVEKMLSELSDVMPAELLTKIQSITGDLKEDIANGRLNVDDLTMERVLAILMEKVDDGDIQHMSKSLMEMFNKEELADGKLPPVLQNIMSQLAAAGVTDQVNQGQLTDLITQMSGLLSDGQVDPANATDLLGQMTKLFGGLGDIDDSKLHALTDKLMTTAQQSSSDASPCNGISKDLLTSLMETMTKAS